jgi:hypothetical protein
VNDDVKAACGRLSGALKGSWRRCGYAKGGLESVQASAVTTLFEEDLHALLAHIDGFDARLEELREACAQSAADYSPRWEADDGVAGAVRATPLTAQPLADEITALKEQLDASQLLLSDTRIACDDLAIEITALRARVAELEKCQRCPRPDAKYHLCGDCGDEPGVMGDVHGERERWKMRAEKAEAERDALRARVFEVEQRQVGYVLVSFASHEQWKAELAALTAQVEAARATCARYIHEDDANSYPADEVLRDILRAMDRAGVPK